MKLTSLIVALCAATLSVSAVRAADEIQINGDAEKGKETFKLYCAACHGETGHGDGLASAALNPKPRNLTDREYMDSLTDEHILKVIRDGGASVGKSPLMTAWGAVLKEDGKIHDVAAYVRSLSAE